MPYCLCTALLCNMLPCYSLLALRRPAMPVTVLLCWLCATVLGIAFLCWLCLRVRCWPMICHALLPVLCLPLRCDTLRYCQSGSLRSFAMHHWPWCPVLYRTFLCNVASAIQCGALLYLPLLALSSHPNLCRSLHCCRYGAMHDSAVTYFTLLPMHSVSVQCHAIRYGTLLGLTSFRIAAMQYSALLPMPCFATNAMRCYAGRALRYGTALSHPVLALRYDPCPVHCCPSLAVLRTALRCHPNSCGCILCFAAVTILCAARLALQCHFTLEIPRRLGLEHPDSAPCWCQEGRAASQPP